MSKQIQPAALQPAALQPAALQPAALQPAALQTAALETKGAKNMNYINSLSITAFLAMTFLFGACSQPLENLPVDAVAQTPAADTTQDLTQPVDQDDSAEETGVLQIEGVPCLTYKVKKYSFNWSVQEQAGVAYGTVRATKSPSCTSPIKVSLEGANTISKPTNGINTPAGRFAGQFDSPMILHNGNDYYTSFNLTQGGNLRPGTYKMALRIQAGNVSKAVTLITVNLTR
jgi:hypothetical protein